MKLIDAYRLYRSSDGEIVKLTIRKGLDATDYEGLDTLLNPNLLREAEVYVHDIRWKFGGKQCVEKDGVKIPLSYLPCKGKLFLEPVLDAADDAIKNIIVKCPELSETVEEALLGRVAVNDLQEILGGPSDLCVKKTLENTTRFYGKDGDRVTGVLHPRGHVKRRLPKLSVRCLKGTICTDTVFCSNVTSMNGYNCFQLFWGKLSKFLYAVPLKSEKNNFEALEEFIAQVGVPERVHFDNAKSQISKAWKKIARRWGMKKTTIEPHNQNQNGMERMVQVVKNRTSFSMELYNAPKEYWCYALLLLVATYNRTSNASLGWKTPYEMAFGETPDTSCLRYKFYQPIRV